MREDSIFIVNVEQYVLRSRRKRLPKTGLICLFFMYVSFVEMKKRPIKFTANAVSGFDRPHNAISTNQWYNLVGNRYEICTRQLFFSIERETIFTIWSRNQKQFSVISLYLEMRQISMKIDLFSYTLSTYVGYIIFITLGDMHWYMHNYHMHQSPRSFYGQYHFDDNVKRFFSSCQLCPSMLRGSVCWTTRTCTQPDFVVS